MADTTTLYAARNRDFAPALHYEYYGDALPLSGATASMQVRQYPGAAGDPEVEDADCTITDVGQIGTGVDPADGVEKAIREVLIEPSILRDDLASMPGQDEPEPGDEQTFYYEVTLTYADLAQDTLAIGQFILSAGVDDT